MQINLLDPYAKGTLLLFFITLLMLLRALTAYKFEISRLLFRELFQSFIHTTNSLSILLIHI